MNIEQYVDAIGQFVDLSTLDMSSDEIDNYAVEMLEAGYSAEEAAAGLCLENIPDQFHLQGE